MNDHSATVYPDDSESIDEDLRQELLLERLEYVFRESRTGLVSTIILATLAMAALCFDHLRADALWWYVYMLGSVGIRFLILKGYRSAQKAKADLSSWEGKMCGGVFLSGAGWGFLGWHFFVGADLLGVTVVVFSIAGMTAGAIAALAALSRVYACFLFPAIIPLIAKCMMVGKAEYIFMGLMALTFTGFLLMMARLFRSNLQRSLILSHRNDDLVQTLTKEKEKAEAASEAKTNFLATMSHEIRTPLNGVLGMLQVIRGTEINEVQKDYVETAEKSAGALLELLNDILDVSRAEAGKLVIRSAPFPLAEVITNVVDVFRPRASAKSLKLLVRLDRRLSPMLVGDETRIRQVMSNLLSNAVKFTEQGSVLVNVIVEADKPDAQRLRFEVTDTGVGISPEDQGRLFAAFTQIDSSMSRKHGGAGLGLAICQRLVDMMGGTISLHSEPGSGSKFHFTLVMQKQTIRDGMNTNYSEGSPIGKGEGEQSLFSGVKVLVVEDESVNQRVAKLLFSQLGVEPFIAPNGKIALEMLEKSQFDLVFMDLQLPLMDGMEVTRAIRNTYTAEALPVIALTANAKPEDRQHCLDAGMNDFLAKPYRKESLRVCLEYWITKLRG